MDRTVSKAMTAAAAAAVLAGMAISTVPAQAAAREVVATSCQRDVGWGNGYVDFVYVNGQLTEVFANLQSSTPRGMALTVLDKGGNVIYMPANVKDTDYLFRLPKAIRSAADVAFVSQVGGEAVLVGRSDKADDRAPGAEYANCEIR